MLCWCCNIINSIMLLSHFPPSELLVVEELEDGVLFLLLGGMMTCSRCSSHCGSSPTPEHLPSKIMSVHRLRCFTPYLQSKPLLSRSHTKFTCISFHNSFCSCVAVFSPCCISSFLLLLVALLLSAIKHVE